MLRSEEKPERGGEMGEGAGRIKLRETVSYVSQFFIKDMTEDTDEQPDEQVHRAKSGNVPSSGTPVPMVQ